MTMHLVNGMSAIRTTKPRSSKLTKAKRKELEVEWRKYNKEMRRKHMHSCQINNFDDYVAYVNGTYKQPKSSKQEFRELQHSNSFRRETPKIPSMETRAGVAPKRESQQYTGTLVKGLCTMHKSNAVPVISNEQAIEIANMRRN